MSTVLQTVATVVATPLPTPQVVKETFTVPAQTPAVVIQAIQLAVIFGSALVLSIVHKAVEWYTAREKGWGTQLNVLVGTVYSAGVALVGTASMHQLGTDATQLVTLALSGTVALTGSFWTYALRKATASIIPSSSTSTATPTVSLATDADPANGVG